MIYATDLPYTVPTPKGKSAGVGYDGRLHALCARVPGNAGGEMAGLILRYTLTDATFEWRYGNDSTDAPIEGGTTFIQLNSETAVVAFSGETHGSPLAILWQGVGGGFRWLPAGTVVDLIVDPDQFAGTLTVEGVMVEDFGQLAEGDEYSDRVRASDFGGLLLRES